MYDKTVRRRRAVLGLLVAVSLILLTAYFGESAAGGLHSVQRGFLTVVSPIQNGASQALKPVRDLFGWIGDTLGAKSERDRLRKEVRVLQSQSVQNVAAARQALQLQSLLKLDKTLALSSYQPVTGSVIGQSPNLWNVSVTLDRGSADGVHTDDPVLNGDGLVGKVTTVTAHASLVTLITNHSSGVSAKDNSTGAAGILQPAVGNPSELRLQYVRHGDKIAPGDVIVTSGTISSRLDSLFPRDIPVGRVTRVDNGDLFQGVHVAPMVDLRQLDTLQVLTHGPHGIPTNVAPGQ
ncbi:MAG: rod shape-determining protein MreC [Solirubrobacteraceae bacterium]